MPITESRPLGIYYEHPEWFRPLFTELERRDLPYRRVSAYGHSYDSENSIPPYSVFFNRMSPSAYLRGNGHCIFYTLHYLAHLKALGVRVVNGYDAFVIETSKALQLSLLERLGLPYPRTRVVNNARQALQVALTLRFPVVLKPNVGGSGAGIQRFDSYDELREAVDANNVSLGMDSTILVQEFIPPRDGCIVRVEVLGGRSLYAIRVPVTDGSFNLCPAELCAGDRDAALKHEDSLSATSNHKVEAFTPSPIIHRQIEFIMAAAEIEVGGIEYVTDARDGRIYYYDINATSNFVANAYSVIGFDPFENLVSYLEKQAA
jgi:hypothetical protein